MTPLRTRGKYVSGENGEKEERFTCIMSLVFVLCAVNYVYAVVVSALVLKVWPLTQFSKAFLFVKTH